VFSMLAAAGWGERVLPAADALEEADRVGLLVTPELGQVLEGSHCCGTSRPARERRREEDSSSRHGDERKEEYEGGWWWWGVGVGRGRERGGAQSKGSKPLRRKHV
jgi:hypothetical protein